MEGLVFFSKLYHFILDYRNLNLMLKLKNWFGKTNFLIWSNPMEYLVR